MDLQDNSVAQKRDKYVIKNPYCEDRDSYNLKQCIQERRKPNFGYPLPELSDSSALSSRTASEPVERQGIDFQFILPSVIAMRREKQIMDHVLKCFTWGKPVRRDVPLVGKDGSRINEIKSKFNRVRLIRQYFSVKRRNLNRKFDYPVDQLGNILRNPGKKKDFQQYCVESDFEHEYPRRNKAEKIKATNQVLHLKDKKFGKDQLSSARQIELSE